MKLVIVLRLAGIAFMTACVLGACSSAAGPTLTPHRTNCEVACKKAHDCLNSGVDVEACTNACDDQSSNDTFATNVKNCADCVEPRACADVSGCISDCLAGFAH